MQLFGGGDLLAALAQDDARCLGWTRRVRCISYMARDPPSAYLLIARDAECWCGVGVDDSATLGTVGLH